MTPGMRCVDCGDSFEPGIDGVGDDDFGQCAWCHFFEWGVFPTGMTPDEYFTDYLPEHPEEAE